MKPSYKSASMLVADARDPLADHLDAFVASLIEQQYAASVVYIKARHAMAFDRWLAKRRFALAELSEDHIQQYQRRRRRHGPVRAETRLRELYEVTQLLRFLRGRGVSEAAPADITPAAELAFSFGEHLQRQQGLATTTIKRYRAVALQFLQVRFGGGPIDLRALCAADVIGFVRCQAKRLKPPVLKLVVTAMRSFLRYAEFCGEISPGLIEAAPAVATWAVTPSLPKAISPEHAQRAIDSCDRRRSSGLRDRAVLLLLARLGLRAHEIVALQLDDCDWESACLRVCGKGGRTRLLPIPADVGEAITAYLARSRPVSQDRHLFLRAVAPFRGFKPGAYGVGSIVQRALRRAGVDAPHRGTHQFRHALAVRMLERGASLVEIGDVLGHHSPQTTSIYARVDISSLRSLALQWPGGAQ